MSSEYDEPAQNSTTDDSSNIPLSRRDTLIGLGVLAAGGAGVAGYTATRDSGSDNAGAAGSTKGDGEGAVVNRSEDDDQYDDTATEDEDYGEENSTTTDDGQSGSIDVPPDSELFDYTEETVREYLQPKDNGGSWSITNGNEDFVGYRMLNGHRYKKTGNVYDADVDDDHGDLWTPGIHREDWVLPFITDETFLDGLSWEIEMADNSGGFVTYRGDVPKEELHEIDTGVYIGAMDLSPWSDHMGHDFNSSEGEHNLITEKGDLS